MGCSEYQELLSAYYDDELAPELRIRVESHIEGCFKCSQELVGFERLSSIAVRGDGPNPPDSVWAAVSQVLDGSESDGQVVIAKNVSSKNHSQILKYIAAVSATMLLGLVGFQLFLSGGHDHKEMAEAIEYVAANVDLDGISSHLLGKYDGGIISPDDAFSQVGYRPIASNGLPSGYTVESIHIIDMPCCKCTQTACLRSDDSRFFIFEHDNEDTGWFEHRIKRKRNCGGWDCKIIELDNRLAATYKTGNRHVTMLGVRDLEEIDLLVSRFEEKP